MFQEITRYVINLTKYEDIDLAWHHNVLTVRCDNGLHLLDLAYNLKCFDKNIDLAESVIHTSKSSPATDLFPPVVMRQGMKNENLMKLMLDPALWPHSKKLLDASINVGFEWSPADFIHNNECVLATLNTAGNIDLYARGKSKWKKLEDLSIKLKEEMTSKSLVAAISHSGPLNVPAVQQAAYALEPYSICWAPELNEDGSCFFVTAQKDGKILFWKLKYDDGNVEADFVEGIVTKENILIMKWIPINDDQFILVCSNALGQIHAYEYMLAHNVFKYINTHSLWKHADKMISNYIQYNICTDYIILAATKHRHLILQMIDRNLKVVSQNIMNINDQKITSLTTNDNDFYVSTINREVYKVSYEINGENMNAKFALLELRGIPTTSELYGISFSNNNVILATALLDRRVLYRKEPLKVDIIFYTLDLGHESDILIILNNPNKFLTNMWDVIESIRCKSMKLKALPSTDYHKLYEHAETEIYFAKVYLILLTIYHSLEDMIQNATKGLLPETSLELVRSNILVCYALSLIKEIYQVITQSEYAIDDFCYETFTAAGVYVEDYCRKYEKELDNYLSPEIIQILRAKKQQFEYTCQCCDEKLVGFTCKDGHLNMFCFVTFTPIESDNYFICKNCGFTAKGELEKPMCVFCDLYLCKYF